MNKAITVPFHGNNLFVIDFNGQPYTPMKPIVEGMGMDWMGQFTKLKQRFKSTIEEISIVAADGKSRPMICLALRKLSAWLNTISPNKVRPEIRDRVIQYQDECDDVLYKYWTDGEVTNPRRSVGRPKKDRSGELSVEQQEAIKQIVLTRGKSVPQERQAKAIITLWSALKSHFGCSYKDISSDKFVEALSIAARIPLEGELLERDRIQIQTQPQSIFNLSAIDQDGEWRLKIKDGRVTSARRLDDGEYIISVASFGELMERAGNIIIHYTDLQRMNPSELVGLVDKMRKHHHHWQLIMNQKNKIA